MKLKFQVQSIMETIQAAERQPGVRREHGKHWICTLSVHAGESAAGQIQFRCHERPQWNVGDDVEAHFGACPEPAEGGEAQPAEKSAQAPKQEAQAQARGRERGR